MTGTIDVQEFISHLYKSGLVIVDKKEFIKKSEIELTQLRKKILRDQTCSVSDVVKCKLFRRTYKSIFTIAKIIKRFYLFRVSR